MGGLNGPPRYTEGWASLPRRSSEQAGLPRRSSERSRVAHLQSLRGFRDIVATTPDRRLGTPEIVALSSDKTRRPITNGPTRKIRIDSESTPPIRQFEMPISEGIPSEITSSDSRRVNSVQNQLSRVPDYRRGGVDPRPCSGLQIRIFQSDAGRG